MADLPERIAALVGEDVLRITDASSRWPAFGELVVEGVATPVALYAGLVGLSQRNRDDVERRFQNPGSDRPILEIPGRDLLLLGLWEGDPYVDVDQPLLVSADPMHRVGQRTRFSVFISLGMLLTALETGWGEDATSIGETMRAFLPPLLPLSHAADRDGVSPDVSGMQAAIEGSGLMTAEEPEIPEAAERTRQVGSRLVRDSRFSRRVVDAYEGLCAMCGLDVGLVQGAHIYPVSALGSHDEPWNGLALCGNHHLAFDRHLVGVCPEDFGIVFHDEILDQVTGSPAVAALVDVTFEQLARPTQRPARPRAEMFAQRYEFYVDRYDWLVEREPAVKPTDPDWPQPTSPAASAVMRGNRWRDTSPEVAVRSILQSRGRRFRKRHTIRLGDRRWTQPDAVFTRARVVLFVDGCFWHRCPEHGTEPGANTAYWGPKLDRNVARDRDTDARLTSMGWMVIRAWEHEDPFDIADRVEAALDTRLAEAAS